MFYITPQSWSILLCVHWRAAEAHQTQILFGLQLSTAVKSSGFLTCYLEKTSSSLLVVFSSIDSLLTAGIVTYGRKHKSPGDTLCTSNQGWQTGVSLHVQGYVMDRGIHTFWNSWAPLSSGFLTFAFNSNVSGAFCCFPNFFHFSFDVCFPKVASCSSRWTHWNVPKWLQVAV